ncbi:MAG: anhydro-N-acetylmuramic acid kinase [Rhodothermales bacterium]|jgi:anhydro-N-acetylmuramic acid kinase
MSGTSLDGIDVAIVTLAGSGRRMEVRVDATGSTNFPPLLAAELRHAAEDASYPVDSFTLLGPRLAQVYAESIRHVCGVSGIDLKQINLVGCHGQTIRHQPEPRPYGGGKTAGTLQMGSGSVLSALLNIPVVSDFRDSDVALGGQGAPLVPYLDYVLLSSPTENRVALNLGGIANLTALKAGGSLAEVTAFDTGPANMVMDALAARLLKEPFDRDGQAASQGRVLPSVLERALGHPYFQRSPPKSAGRQSGEAGFGSHFAAQFLEWGVGESTPNLLATAAQLTVESIGSAIDRFVPFAPDQIVASGGGTRNRFLMQRLCERLGKVSASDEFGVDSHYKEALAFAVLAHEAVNGVETGMPSVTGASRSTVLGSISWP